MASANVAQAIKSRPASVKPVAPAPVTPAAEVIAADPWASLMESATIAPAFVRGTRTVNVTVPEPVKAMLEASLKAWNLAFDDPNGVRLEVGTAKFQVVDLGSDKTAKEFIGYCKAWATNREGGQVSVRAFQVKDSSKGAGKDALTTVVKFAAMPLVKNETRSMTAANGDSSAKVREWARAAGIDVPDRGKLKPEIFERYNSIFPAEIPGQTTVTEAVTETVTETVSE